MIKIRRKLAAIIMTGFLMAATTFAKDGLLLSDLTGEGQPQTCTQTDGGILMSDFTGVVISGFTGVVISGVITTETECGK